MSAGAIQRFELPGGFDHRRDVGAEAPGGEAVQDGIQDGCQALFTLIAGLGIGKTAESFSIIRAQRSGTNRRLACRRLQGPGARCHLGTGRMPCQEKDQRAKHPDNWSVTGTEASRSRFDVGTRRGSIPAGRLA